VLSTRVQREAEAAERVGLLAVLFFCQACGRSLGEILFDPQKRGFLINWAKGPDGHTRQRGRHGGARQGPRGWWQTHEIGVRHTVFHWRCGEGHTPERRSDRLAVMILREAANGRRPVKVWV
jgi:hypothetical protein